VSFGSFGESERTGLPLTDVNGLNHAFHLGKDWVNFAVPVKFILMGIALASVASLMFLLTKKAFRWTGALSIVASLVAAVVGTENLGFRA